MSIFSSLVPEAHPNHNVFDLSRRDVMSMKSAMITPCFVQHTIPNATYEISVMNQIEVSSMAKANFARMKQNLEYYFIPYSQLWRWFETFYYNRLDPVRSPSNVQNPSVPTSSLYFDLKSTVNILREDFLANRFANLFAEVFLENNPFHYLEKDWIINWIYDNCFSSESVFLSEDFAQKDVHNRHCPEDSIRILDNLGYGNFLSSIKYDFDIVCKGISIPVIIGEDTVNFNGLPGIRSVFDRIVKYVVNTSQVTEATGILDACEDFLIGFFTAAGEVEYGDTYDFSEIENFVNSELSPWFDNSISTNSTYVSPFPILGYLKLFSDNFRSTQYDTENYSYFYNYDYMSASVQEVPVDRILQCLIPRYRLYRRDIVTGTYPNSQFGEVAVATLQNPTTITYDDTALSVRNLSIPAASKDVTVGGVASANKFNVNTGISALAIRQAEALQRYKEKNLRAGNRLKNQQGAFFGDKSQFLEEDYSKFLQSTDTAILINSVVATSESDGVNLGDKGSTAASALGDGTFTFHSHDFGMIIGVMYVLPQAEYENYGIDPQLLKLENGDFFHPDLQNLGLSPVLSDVIDRIQPENGGLTDHIYTLGFSAHDWEYKTSIDRVHGEFNTLNGVFGDYVTPRKFEGNLGLALSDLYASPNDIDTIFYQASDTFQSSDQFKVNLYHRIKAVLPMSVTGLPY